VCLTLVRDCRKESHNILWLKNGVAALVEHIAKGGDAAATPSQVNAVRALAELARYRKNRVRIGNSQAIPPLLKHLKNSSGNPQLALAALFILEDITQKDTLLENFRLAKPLDALMVQLVGGGEVAHEEVQANCLTLIQRTVKNHGTSSALGAPRWASPDRELTHRDVGLNGQLQFLRRSASAC
jgi:hypothetical protein